MLKICKIILYLLLLYIGDEFLLNHLVNFNIFFFTNNENNNIFFDNLFESLNIENNTNNNSNVIANLTISDDDITKIINNTYNNKFFKLLWQRYGLTEYDFLKSETFYNILINFNKSYYNYIYYIYKSSLVDALKNILDIKDLHTFTQYYVNDRFFINNEGKVRWIMCRLPDEAFEDDPNWYNYTYKDFRSPCIWSERHEYDKQEWLTMRAYPGGPTCREVYEAKLRFLKCFCNFHIRTFLRIHPGGIENIPPLPPGYNGRNLLISQILTLWREQCLEPSENGWSGRPLEEHEYPTLDDF